VEECSFESFKLGTVSFNCPCSVRDWVGRIETEFIIVTISGKLHYSEAS